MSFLLLDFPNNINFGFQEAGSFLFIERARLYNFYLYYGLIVLVLVLFLLFRLLCSYNIKLINNNIILDLDNLIEILYTLLPCILLVILFLPSIKLLYLSDKIGYINTYLNIIGYQ